MDTEKDMVAVQFIPIGCKHHTANRHSNIIEIFIFAKFMPELNPLCTLGFKCLEVFSDVRVFFAFCALRINFFTVSTQLPFFLRTKLRHIIFYKLMLVVTIWNK